MQVSFNEKIGHSLDPIDFQNSTGDSSLNALGALPPGALAGLRVLDLTHLLAGPYCTMILGDLGAEVVKLESPHGGDITRSITDTNGASAYFGSVNRNKQSVVLDLKNPAGLDLLYRLADKADVFVHNLGPGVADRLGIGPAAMTERFPRLIYAVVTGFGLDGPWADRKGVDPSIQALSGAMDITGYPDAAPARVGFSIADLSGGVFLVMGVLAALVERAKSGKGQVLDVSLLEAQMSLLENAIVRSLNGDRVPTRLGTTHPFETLTRTYETSDGLMIVGLSARNWKAACKLMGHPEWSDDPRLNPPHAHLPELLPMIEASLRARPRAYWQAQFNALNVQCTPVLNTREAAELPPIKERQFIQQTTNSQGLSLRVAGSPLRLSRTPPRIISAAPLLGEHTHDVMKRWLDIGKDEYHDLDKQGVFTPSERKVAAFW